MKNQACHPDPAFRCNGWMIYLLLLLSGLATIRADAQDHASRSPKTYLNLPYNQTLSGAVNLLDVFLPDSSYPAHYPVMIIIHGGAWAEGDKELESLYYMRRLKSELLKNGLAVVSINYRLVGKDIHLPAPLEDCKDAIRWVRAHGDQYGLDTANIGLWGGSAGGHLALMAAYTANEAFPGDPALAAYSSSVNYIIDNFGPSDLNALFRTGLGGLGQFAFKLFSGALFEVREKLVFAMTGYQLKTDKKMVKEICEQYSPVSYACQQTVPTLIFHGTADKVVPVSQSELLKKLLDCASVENQLIKVKDGDHGFNNLSHAAVDRLIDQCLGFVKKHLR